MWFVMRGLIMIALLFLKDLYFHKEFDISLRIGICLKTGKEAAKQYANMKSSGKSK